jgi:hypothetical protein
VWDTLGDDQTLKGEHKANLRLVLHSSESTAIGVTVISWHRNDLAWDGESKRIIAVGDGKKEVGVLTSFNLVQRHSLATNRFGHAFMMASGTSTGEITAHAKVYILPITLS